MKRLMLVAALMAAGPVYAEQSTARQAVGQTMSPEEQAQLKAQLKGLAQGFGIETPKPKEEPKEPEKKTMADVADKALDLSAKFVTSVASMLEKAAPMVLEIMVRQQYAKAVGMLVGPWSAFFGFLIAAIIVRRRWKLTEREAGESYFPDNTPLSRRGVRGLITFFIPTVVCTILGSVGTYNLGEAVAILINPRYYAIRDLLQMLLNPGSL